MKTVKLGEVAEIERAVIDASEISSGTMYVGLENIESSGQFSGVRPVESGELASAKFRFTGAHLLYGKLRPYLSKIACPDFVGVCSTDILPVLPGRDIDRRYLHHCLRTPNMVAKATSLCAGANLPRLSPKLLEQFEIPLPALAEQKRIAGILDAADALRAQRRRALARLDDLARSLFLHHFGDPVSNPKAWPVVPIGDVCELIVDCVNRTAPIVEGPTPFKMIRTTNVKAGKVNLTEVRYVTEDVFIQWNRRATPQPGDVLLTREAPVGEAGIIESDDSVFLGQRLMLYRANQERIMPTYLLYSFRGSFLQHQFDQFASGSTVKHLPLPACRSFQVHLPPLALQQQFACELAAVEAQKARQRTHLARLDTLFASLQHDAFTGGL